MKTLCLIACLALTACRTVEPPVPPLPPSPSPVLRVSTAKARPMVLVGQPINVVVEPPVLGFTNAAIAFETNIVVTPLFTAQVIGMQSNHTYVIACVYGTNNWEAHLGPPRRIPEGATNGWLFTTYELPPSPFATVDSFRVIDVTP